jgi:replication factor A1
MSSEELVEKIAEEADISEEEVKEEIEEKMEEFSGMVSEEGAIHLVAKENGIDVSEADNSDLKIENIVPDMRKVKVKARVTTVLDPNTFERDDGDEGKVQNMVLADDTGTIRLTLWDEQTQIAEKVGEGDAIKLGGAYTVEDNQGNAELRLGDDAQVKKADDDEVPEVETGGGEAEKVTIREVQDENSNYEINGMIMTVYTSNPFYRVDPETGDTVRENDDGDYVTDDGKEVEEPDHRLALSAVIDDGTGNIRTVFFSDEARELLEIEKETEKDGDVHAVEDAAEKAVGKKLRLTGRTRYNDYFSTLEILVNDIEQRNIDEELAELLELMEA